MEEPPPPSIRLLMVEDVAAHAERTVHQLKRSGMTCELLRVETATALKAALETFDPTLILSDFSLPQFDGMSALQICQDHLPDVPFIFLSGTIGEERAIEALRAGAVDYVLKDNLQRLVPAVRRALRDAQVKTQRSREQAQISRLNRLLRMLKGVNDAAVRCRDRNELLTETCRLAVSLGNYGLALAATRTASAVSISALASEGVDADMMARVRTYVQESAARPESAIGNVFRHGREFVCNDTANPDITARFDQLTINLGMRSVVALPLFVDGATSAVLLLAAKASGRLEEEELGMLRDLARSLSFGLQYVHRDTRARFLSHFDPQTGLARRSLFCERLRELLLAETSRGAIHAVMLMDLRHLATINDSFGRHAGDLLLRHVAESLKRHFSRQEQLAHFGGGTFAAVIRVDGDSVLRLRALLEQHAQRLFGRPYQLEGRALPVSVRLGCALHPDDAGDATSLLQNAETALQMARADGLSFVRFSQAVHRQNLGRLALEHRMRFALEREEFELYYQPKVNVVTRRIHGAEALLRWRSPEDGLVSPDAFLPVLESSGLMLQVGEWVVRQAAKDCRRWMDAGLPPIRVAVNIAPLQLRQHDFEERFSDASGSWPIGGGGLDIEITEGVLQEDCSGEIRMLERLRDLGVRIAIDDFGTGYSSLSRLSALPVDTLKIDRRFTSQMLHNPTGAAVVRTVVALARAFNMTSVAEGVERQEELDLLWQVGCDHSQGFLHSPALRAADFAAILRHGKGALIQPPLRKELRALKAS